MGGWVGGWMRRIDMHRESEWVGGWVGGWVGRRVDEWVGRWVGYLFAGGGARLAFCE